MTTLLFPGRHLLLTNFQRDYLQRILHVPLKQLEWFGRVTPDLEPIDRVIFAVTSCNQANSRYNSIPFFVRAIGVDRFARSLQPSLNFEYRIFGIPHYRPTPRFAEYVLKEIAAQTEDTLFLTPVNCVVMCSTPTVIQQYRALNFGVLPAELQQNGALTPVEVLKRFVAVGEAWPTDDGLRQHQSAVSQDLWKDFAEVPRRVLRLWRDPLLNDAGSLTATRDYSSYAYEMAKPAVIQLKYDDIRDAIKPGKIVDEGCADGALLACVANGFPDCDLVGIELTGEFLARCRERQRVGDFRESFVHFYQRNIMEPIFTDDSIDTTICNSTIHELWSYGRQQETVHDYLVHKFNQTVPGGRLLVRDVVGPLNKDNQVYLWLNHENGDGDPLKDFSDRTELGQHLDGLSTYDLFIRFAHDHLREMRHSGQRSPQTRVDYEEFQEGGRRFVIVSLRHAAEFLGKMAYTHNWNSEMHEEFTFWDFHEWCDAVRRAGFQVIRNHSDENEDGSREYCNPWIFENRYDGRAQLFVRRGGRLVMQPYPSTNIVIVAEKPRAGLEIDVDQQLAGDLLNSGTIRQ